LLHDGHMLRLIFCDLGDVDRFTYYYASSWFETCRTILVII
jgi:hypothetical protein